MAYEEVTVKKPLMLRILPVASLMLFLVGWQLIVDLEIVPSSLLASPTQVINSLW